MELWEMGKFSSLTWKNASESERMSVVLQLFNGKSAGNKYLFPVLVYS
jgi:hypothetical protein